MKTLIKTIEIPVEDIVRAQAWYEKAFEFKANWSDENHVLLQSGNKEDPVKLLLVKTMDPVRLSFKSTHTNIEHSVVDFETDELDRFHQHLTTLIPNLPAIPEPANKWAPRGFSFCDSEGNRLAVFCYNRASQS